MGDELTRCTAGPGQDGAGSGFLVPVADPVVAAWTVNHLLPPPAVGRIEQLRNLLLVLAGSPGLAEHRSADVCRHRPLTGMPRSGNVVHLRLPVPTPIRLTAQAARRPLQCRATGAQKTKARPGQPCLSASTSRAESADQDRVSDGIRRSH
jgi:hypothetical protein